MGLKYFRNILFSLLLIIAFWAGTSKFTGSPGGKTGSPIDGSDCTGCHNDYDAITKDNWISTNIPETGYIPGKTYEIKIDAYHEGSVRIGFEITSETASIKAGTWALIDTVKTRFTNDSLAITHTAKGSAAADSVHWIMKWTAPAAASGDVVFYAGVNATNSDLSTAGDQVYLTAKRIKEEGTAGINEFSRNKEFIRFWPNPTTNYLNIETVDGINIEKLEILNLQGSILHEVFQLSKNGQIFLQNIPKGVLFLRIYVDGKTYLLPFIKY